MIDKEIENEMYDFIVGTNNEENLCNSIQNKRLHKKMRKYFSLD